MRSNLTALEFIPGLRRNELIFREIVSPILTTDFPKLAYSTGLVGPGSDVLGYDTMRSNDPEWGPRLVVLLREQKRERLSVSIDRKLQERLPPVFRGY